MGQTIELERSEFGDSGSNPSRRSVSRTPSPESHPSPMREIPLTLAVKKA